jgi:hypothetical protein
MAMKRRIKKYTGNLQKLGINKYLVCKECDIEEVKVGTDIKAVTCANCVQKLVAPPPSVKKKTVGEKFPRGWHFKARYVHTNGKVYKKGVLTDEIDTPVVAKPKKKTAVKKAVKKTVKKGKSK